MREFVEREQVDARHAHRVGAQQSGGGGRVRAGHHEVRAPVQQQHPERAVQRHRVRMRRSRSRRRYRSFGRPFRVGERVNAAARTRRQRIAARRE